MVESLTRRRITADTAQRVAKCYRVSLTERATIVERGEALQIWWVRLNDAWVRASEHPKATIELESNSDEEPVSYGPHTTCGPGTIWQRNTELLLERGTRLLQRQTWPLTRELSVMGYLSLGLPNAQRVVQEREYTVVGNYRLIVVGRARTRAEPRPPPTSRGGPDGAPAA